MFTSFSHTLLCSTCRTQELYVEFCCTGWFNIWCLFHEWRCRHLQRRVAILGQNVRKTGHEWILCYRPTQIPGGLAWVEVPRLDWFRLYLSVPFRWKTSSRRTLAWTWQVQRWVWILMHWAGWRSSAHRSWTPHCRIESRNPSEPSRHAVLGLYLLYVV